MAVLDPALKLGYLDVTWEEHYLNAGLERFKSRVSLSFCTYDDADDNDRLFYSFLPIKQTMKLPKRSLCRLPYQCLLVPVSRYVLLLTLSNQFDSPFVNGLMDRIDDQEEAAEKGGIRGCCSRVGSCGPFGGASAVSPATTVEAGGLSQSDHLVGGKDF